MNHEFQLKAKHKLKNIPPPVSFIEILNLKSKIRTNLIGITAVIDNLQSAKLVHNSGYFGRLIQNADDAVQLRLNLFEAFYLQFALGTIEIFEDDQPLTIDECWSKFQNLYQSFITSYIVYHHFRSKGWVVRGGEKFAGDLLLYKDGPEYYHASYVVIIDLESDKIKWEKIVPIVRVAESAKKDVLLVRLGLEESTNWSSVANSLTCLDKVSLDEFLIDRWVP